METPPPLPSSAKPGLGAGKIVLIVFASLGALLVLALVGLYALGSSANGVGSTQDVGFAPADIEARCRQNGLEYYAGESSSRLWSRANEQQQERLKALGIKLYRVKIRKKYDVVYIVSVIEAPRDFTPSLAKEVLEVLAPATPVAINGRFIYCFAGRPDPRGKGDEIIWMKPQQMFEALGR